MICGIYIYIRDSGRGPAARDRLRRPDSSYSAGEGTWMRGSVVGAGVLALLASSQMWRIWVASNPEGPYILYYYGIRSPKPLLGWSFSA